MGIKENHAWSSKLVGKAVTGKAASKHWPAWVAATGADPDDAVADRLDCGVNTTDYVRAEILGPGHAAQELEAHAAITQQRPSLQNAR